MKADPEADREALQRFIEAVEAGKHPRAADARIAVAIVREAISAPKPRFAPKARGPGQPKRDDEHKKGSEFLLEKELEAMFALARRVRRRDPKGEDFAKVGKDHAISTSTMSRYWRESHGDFARRMVAFEIEAKRVKPILEEMVSFFGEEVAKLSIVALRPLIERWRKANFTTRPALEQEIRGILDREFPK